MCIYPQYEPIMLGSHLLNKMTVQKRYSTMKPSRLLYISHDSHEHQITEQDLYMV